MAGEARNRVKPGDVVVVVETHKGAMPAGSLEKMRAAYALAPTRFTPGSRATACGYATMNFALEQIRRGHRRGARAGQEIFRRQQPAAAQRQGAHLPARHGAGHRNAPGRADHGRPRPDHDGARALARDADPSLGAGQHRQLCGGEILAEAWACTRIILSRELSLDEIAEIRQECPDIELEVFVHGALCIAYSGRCLLSGYFNHRDPNQGTCTNSCRWNYARKGHVTQHGRSRASAWRATSTSTSPGGRQIRLRRLRRCRATR